MLFLRISDKNKISRSRLRLAKALRGIATLLPLIVLLIAMSPKSFAFATLIGDTGIESSVDSNANGKAQAFRFAASANGTVTNLTVYVDSTSTAGTIVAGIYSNSNSHPSSLLAQGSITAPQAGAWNQIAISGVTVRSGRTYWIALLGTTSGRAYFRSRQAGTCPSEGSTQTTLTSLPSTWQTKEKWTVCPASVYGTTSSTTTGSFALSGNVTGAPSVLLQLNGAASSTATSDASGNYSFSGLANGNYTVTPSKAGYSFSPSTQSSTVNGANVLGVNFSATAQTYSISGTIASGSGATVTLSGAISGTTTADVSGNYSFGALSSGNYTVTPSKPGTSITPTSQSITVNGANYGGVNFSVTTNTSANIYYVNNSLSVPCSDSSPGTASAPWCTIGRATGVMIPGDTVIVMPGIYHESVVPHSGSAGKVISYQAQPGAILDGTGTTAQALNILNVSYVSVSGFEITNYKNPRPAGNSVYVHGSSNNIRLSNLLVHDNWNGIIVGDTANQITLTNSVVFNARYGVGFENSSHDIYVDGVTSHHSSELYIGSLDAPPYVNGDGFSADPATKNITIKNAVAYSCADGGFDMESSNVSCTNCKSYNNRYGFRIWNNLGPYTLINALAYGNGWYPLMIQNGPTTTTIYNSTFIGNSADLGSIMRGPGGNLVLRNNIFAGYRGPVISDGVGVISDDYNLYFPSTGGSVPYSLGLHSKTGSPLFVNASANDYHLTLTSPAVDAGTTLIQVPTDIDNVARPQGSSYDMGAYEFTSAP